MTVAVRKLRPARVSVSYSQYYILGGLDLDGGRGNDVIPGLLTELSPQELMVITGLNTGWITVTARSLAGPPAELEPGWDVVGEADLESPEGQIRVFDWAGPDHPELGPLASAGPGLYRLRVHARHRDGGRAEEHLLLVWPSAQRAAPQLLTTLDECGKEYTGQFEVPPPDDVELAAAVVVRDLITLLAQPDPPVWSGRRTVVRADAVMPATPRQVWTMISDPKWWLGYGGSGSLEDGGSFLAEIARSPHLGAEGTFLAQERLKRLVLTWTWTTYRQVEVDREVPQACRFDPVTGEVKAMTRTVRSTEHVPSWPLPADGPTVIEIGLHGDRKGNTAVAVEHRDLPEELAEPMQTFWVWGLRALLPWLTDVPFFLPSWAR
jgi:uncharacterized protein YndB with AHSA1/START domain